MNIKWPTTDQLPTDGKRGRIKIERFEVSEEDAKFTRLREAHGNPGDDVGAGTYVMLRVNGSIMMSNTPTEYRESIVAIRYAYGQMLIGGLGLGIILHPILESKEVEHVTVIELDQDVIDLVQPSLQKWVDAGRLEIICADLREWVPKRGTRYQCVWIDIWPNVCSDWLPEVRALKRKFRRRLKPNGQQDQWGEEQKPWVDTWMDAASYRMR